MAGPEQSIAAVVRAGLAFLFRGVATAEDRRCDSEPEALNASFAGVVVPALSTLPRGVWQVSRNAYDLHHDGRSIADD
jgi:hypothetical protein